MAVTSDQPLWIRLFPTTRRKWAHEALKNAGLDQSIELRLTEHTDVLSTLTGSTAPIVVLDGHGWKKGGIGAHRLHGPDLLPEAFSERQLLRSCEVLILGACSQGLPWVRERWHIAAPQAVLVASAAEEVDDRKGCEVIADVISAWSKTPTGAFDVPTSTAAIAGRCGFVAS